MCSLLQKVGVSFDILTVCINFNLITHLGFSNFHSTLVPEQIKSNDCGLFVCRYLHAMFRLRHLAFSRKQVIDTPKFLFTGDHFNFNQTSMLGICTQYKKLIRELHQVSESVTKVSRKLAKPDETTNIAPPVSCGNNIELCLR